ncbi:beta-glucosidase BoGH3B-like [Populus alba x Populus x berolinensis]|nr:beta-glucosidase BoGH3B-like [Populus alba x Populus x berolinensis]
MQLSEICGSSFAMGLFENPLADYSFADNSEARKHREIAREAVRKSLRAVEKMENMPKSPVVPLPKKASKILGFSHAIVVVGEPQYAETAGDNMNLTLQSRSGIINNVCGAVKCVGVIVSDWTLLWQHGFQEVKAKGVADVLFGDYGFTGKKMEAMTRILMKMMGIMLWLTVLIAMAVGEDVKYKDPKQPVAVRIKDLMSRMTLEEKIGQMVDSLSGYYADLLHGSVLSGGGSAPLPEASAEDWVNMINGFQNGSLSGRLGIPMIYGIDAVHGHNNVCKDPRWGRCYESYSEDHKVVEAMTEIIPGLQGDIPVNSRKGVPYEKGFAACAKHFVGDGGTTKGINENNTVIDKHGLLSIHMPAYSDSIIKVGMGVKMHANRELITGFLKNTLKFKGFVISDWQGIDRITSPPHANYSYSVQAAIQAGIDMVSSSCYGQCHLRLNSSELFSALQRWLRLNNSETWSSGSLCFRSCCLSSTQSSLMILLIWSRAMSSQMDRINDAVGRILLVKFTLGLFENPLADLSLVNELGSQAHRRLG